MILKSFTVSARDEGRRADAFLRDNLPGIAESALRELFSRRDVRLDGVRLRRGDIRVSAGQEMAVYLPSFSVEDPLSVVFENSDVLLVNKPAGISVEADAPGENSLSALCLSHVRVNDPAAASPMPCHRLDNATCGLCLFAKTPEALAILTDVFRRRTLDKRYECLVKGMPKPPSAECSAWLLKDSSRGMVTILDHPADGAKKIMTGYETLEPGPVSRLSVHLITGRTHQIRAHLAALGHPILGDDLYGDRAFNRERKARSLRLCAVSLRLDTSGALPELDGKLFKISAPF